MPAELKFVTIEDNAHIIGPGEYTVCMIAIPWGSQWVKAQPDKVCSACAKRAEGTDEFGVLEASVDTPAGAPDPEVTEPEDEPDEPAPKANKVETGGKRKA